MEETIYNKIKNAVVNANIEGIVYEEDYPKDYVKLTGDPLEDEEMDTMTPLVKAMKVIMDVVKKEGTTDEDLRICFCHLPNEEYWGISIGDGR